MNPTAAGSYAPRLTVRVRADDAPLLEELRGRLNAGKIAGPYEETGRNPVLNWTIVSSDDLQRTVAVFGVHPPKGRKRTEYRLWREAVAIYTSGAAGRKAHRGRLSSLERQLKRIRAYRKSGIQLS